MHSMLDYLPDRQCEAWGLQGHKQVGGALFSLDIATGEAELLLDNWNGLRFNSPNDLAVCNCVVNGPSVFFTDPSCGLQQNFRTDAQLGEYVWRWDLRSGSVQVAADGFVQVLLSKYLCTGTMSCPSQARWLEVQTCMGLV